MPFGKTRTRVKARFQTNKLFVTGRFRGEFLPTVTKISTGTGSIDIIHNKKTIEYM